MDQKLNILTSCRMFLSTKIIRALGHEHQNKNRRPPPPKNNPWIKFSADCRWQEVSTKLKKENIVITKWLNYLNTEKNFIFSIACNLLFFESVPLLLVFSKHYIMVISKVWILETDRNRNKFEFPNLLPVPNLLP